MSLFTPDDLRELLSEFPDKPVKTVIQQIERKAKTMTISSPMGLAKSWLRKAKTIADETTADTQIRTRGTFGARGEWLRESTVASEYESRIVQAARDIRSGFLGPVDAVPLLRERELSELVGEPCLAIWERLSAFDHWPCAHTATSAAQWLKTYVVGR